MATAAATPQAPQTEAEGLAPTYSNTSANSNIIISPNIEITIKGGGINQRREKYRPGSQKELENLFKSFGMKNPQYIEG
ncbi:hypothetical protein WJ0W_006537 [Paenibacillus melissococcoides]|uniref:Uncharacterized protein n=1 Tax=Paenibacillus melissococcoides TaxID=2912268 RepID=A0ABN8UIA8_9BACL|nr:hypothetical protein [Paenibacillus melissococcoides]CAH8249351.1 hypothetical protein WJ0W_006537 [Paenibacillus melissococcoides]